MDIGGVGVRTRARASLAAAASVPAVAKVSARATKRRRVGARDDEKEEREKEKEKELESSCGSPPCDRLLGRSGGCAGHSRTTTPENSLRPAPATEDRCLSPSSYDFASVSCCSSNGSSEVEKEMSDFVDLEEESDGVYASTYHRCRRERREKTPSNEVGAESDDMGSASKPTSEANSRRRPKMPTQAELDDFFAVAEKNEALEDFKDKYNFDFVKEEPLKGRYEWSRIENKAEERSSN